MGNRTTAEGDVFIATFNEKNRTVSDEKLSRIFADYVFRRGDVLNSMGQKSLPGTSETLGKQGAPR